MKSIFIVVDEVEGELAGVGGALDVRREEITGESGEGHGWVTGNVRDI